MKIKETRHQQLIAAVKKAVEDLFSDTSVAAERTAEDLSDVRANIEIKIESIRSDLRRKVAK